MMQINLKYIINAMYSNNFLFVIVSGHALYEGPSCPFASSEQVKSS